MRSRIERFAGILIAVVALISLVSVVAPAEASHCKNCGAPTVALEPPCGDNFETTGGDGRLASLHAPGRHADDDPCSPAGRDRHRRAKRHSDRDRHAVDLYGGGFGVKVAIGRGEPGWHIDFSQAHAGADDLDVRLGLTYRIPEPFILWHFYGGGGIRYTVPEGGAGPYFVTGTEFLFFFWEHGYTFGRGDAADTAMEKFDRAGLRLRF